MNELIKWHYKPNKEDGQMHLTESEELIDSEKLNKQAKMQSGNKPAGGASMGLQGDIAGGGQTPDGRIQRKPGHFRSIEDGLNEGDKEL